MGKQNESMTGEYPIETVFLPPFDTQPNQTASRLSVGIAPLVEAASPRRPPKASIGEDSFQPPNSGVTDTRVVYHNGAVASGVPVVLIYWGQVWSNPPNLQLLQQFDAAARSLVGGPFPSALEQYGVARPWVRPSIQVTSPPPPASFDDGSIKNLVTALIENGNYPEPDEEGGRNFYCVIMPPGTTYGPGGATGAHSFPSTGSAIDTDTAWVAWVGSASLNTMTRTFGHELVETCTDPEGDGWYVDSLGPGGGEIGDLCNSRQGFVNGVWAEYYWSNASNSCILPTTLQTFAQAASVGTICRNPNQMDLFAVDTNGGVNSVWWNGDWHNWFPLGGAAFNQGNPIATICRNPNQMDLFAVGMDGGVYSTWWNGTWNGWFRVL